jgi:hypothetical protein
MDEIDRNPDLSREGMERQRRKAAAQAIADFEASKTLVRAREAVESAVAKYDINPKARDAMLKAMKEAEQGWSRAMDKIAEVPIRGDNLFSTRQSVLAVAKRLRLAGRRGMSALPPKNGRAPSPLKESAKCHKQTLSSGD